MNERKKERKNMEEDEKQSPKRLIRKNFREISTNSCNQKEEKDGRSTDKKTSTGSSHSIIQLHTIPPTRNE